MLNTPFNFLSSLCSVRVHVRFTVLELAFAAHSMMPRVAGRFYVLEPEREPRSENREARTTGTLFDSLTSESRP